MSDSEAPQVPYHAAPEVCHADSGPERVLDSQASEITYHEAPEVYYEAPEAVPTSIPRHDSDAPKEVVQRRKKKILGFSPVLFWTLMTLTFLIIGGAVGGGVGGSAAQRQRASRLAASASPASTAKAIVSVVVSTRYLLSANSASSTIPKSDEKVTSRSLADGSTSIGLSPTISNMVSSSWTSDIIRSSSTIIPSSMPSTSSLPGDHGTGCPASNGTVYSSQGGEKFLFACGDVGEPFYTTLFDNTMATYDRDGVNHCLEQCITWNRSHAPPNICHTVRSYNPVSGGSTYCNLANATYPGHNIGADFDGQSVYAFGFLLDESGNIIRGT